MCKKLKGFKVFAFGLNYDDFHLVVQSRDEANISKLMQALKTNFSRNANRIIINDNEIYPLKATLRDVAFKGVGENYFKMLEKYREHFINKHGHNQMQFPRLKWQKSYHDHVIRDQKDFDNHCYYTAYNFVKHKLPENWKYTSLCYSELVDHSC